MKLLENLKKSISRSRYNISLHAKNEMSLKEDDISEKELIESILGGEVIENYTDDKPFPSCLVFGRTDEGRPIHVVCAYSKEDDVAIIITTYEPDVIRWIDYRRRV
ncbi:MAG: hypothetical protein C4B59_06450 [Candidatus Methanogaster sp.]|uniref:Uncharacterized protein n=1 Tax=Candidatus Methanogaster sp. TaxID=3386292 RepID=A0AC61L3K2_9EURY|nr:MAG: hypothetical protein C4B59_06450 [ANME-2 cluster archaeon]